MQAEALFSDYGLPRGECLDGFVCDFDARLMCALYQVMQCPWSVPEELSLYMEKRQYVSAGCRFTATEEHALLVSCDKGSLRENSLLINRCGIS